MKKPPQAAERRIRYGQHEHKKVPRQVLAAPGGEEVENK